MEPSRLHIEDLRKQDEKTAIAFASQGMHFDDFVQGTALRAYARYFWEKELKRATQVLAAYEGDKLSGVLLVAVTGKKRNKASVLRRWRVSLFEKLAALYGGGKEQYETTNRQLLEEYRKNNRPDGEILFLAADPGVQNKGVGTALLAALAQREPGKEFYLFTDSSCTWQFYEHRGFTRQGSRKIEMTLGGEMIPVECFLYSRKF